MGRLNPVLRDVVNSLPQIMTTRELAKATKIAPSTWATMRYTHTGPEFLKLGGSVRYTKAAVVNWINQKVGE